MTDDTPTTVPAAIVCPVEDCHALVPDTIEDRRAHRTGHTHREKVDAAVRRRFRELQDDFDQLRGEMREKTAEMKRDVEGIDRSVQQIEIPEQQPPLEIKRGGWDDLDDEDDDSFDAPTDDDWGFRNTDTDTEPTVEDRSRNSDRENAIAAFTDFQPAIDRDDDYTGPIRP